MEAQHPADARDHSPLSAHLVIGLLIIGVGVLFTLDNLGLLNAREYLRYWPALLVAVGLSRAVDSWSRRGTGVGGLILVLVGTWLLLDNLEIVFLESADVWPIVLVLVGAAIVWQALQKERRRPTPLDTDALITGFAVLSGLRRGSRSRAFRGGELTAFMGGCEIDLRQAAIDGEAVVDVFAMWGGIEIRVPESWIVIDRVTPLLGGFDDQTRGTHAAATEGGSPPRLIVRGMVIMGGVEIKH